MRTEHFYKEFISQVWRNCKNGVHQTIDSSSYQYLCICSFILRKRLRLHKTSEHSHKKRKDSLETRAIFSWILILTWNFGGGRSGSASTFFKIASASWLWCYLYYNWLFYMLDKDNIICTSVSEAADKIPTDEKDYRKYSFMRFTLYSHSIRRADQHKVHIQIVVYQLGCIQCS